MLLTFEDYKLLGGQLDRIAFNRYSLRAEQIIRGVATTVEENDTFKHCMFDLIDYLSASSVNGEVKDVTHVSNDGYSVTYSDNSKEKKSAILQIIYDYLLDGDYLYKGVNDDDNIEYYGI